MECNSKGKSTRGWKLLGGIYGSRNFEWRLWITLSYQNALLTKGLIKNPDIRNPQRPHQQRALHDWPCQAGGVELLTSKCRFSRQTQKRTVPDQSLSRTTAERGKVSWIRGLCTQGCCQSSHDQVETDGLGRAYVRSSRFVWETEGLPKA